MPAPTPWDRAAIAPAGRDGRRRPELAALPPGLPDVTTLFTFMRDAELRFDTLRLRLVERAAAASGERVVVHELLLRHPGRARVTTRLPDGDPATSHETWLSDGETVQRYRARHRLATSRPVRPRPGGLDDQDLPGRSRPYLPLTVLPANSLVDTFVHPAGYCQNVLATGECRVLGSGPVAGREVVFLACDHPRTIELPADRPDHRLELSVDRETGLIALLVESFGGRVTRRVEATELAPNAPIPEAAFVLAIPEDAASIY